MSGGDAVRASAGANFGLPCNLVYNPLAGDVALPARIGTKTVRDGNASGQAGLYMSPNAPPGTSECVEAHPTLKPREVTMSNAREESGILTRLEGAVLYVTLNRPAAGNALSTGLLAELQELWQRIAADQSVVVVVIEAAGRIFCSGHDLREIQAEPDPRFHYRLATQCTDMMQAITALPQPVIAKVQGTATAAGCQLVATCDLAVASSDARFATPGINIGVWCSMPMVALSRRVAPKHALQFLLTGRLHDAQTAFRIGLINEVVAPENLDAAVRDLADVIAGKSPHTLALGKRAFYHQLGLEPAIAYEYAAQVAVHNNLSEDAREGVAAFLGKRPPVWKGC